MTDAGSLLAVTGGTGFVGRHVVRRALEAGYRVRLLARFPVETCEKGIEHRPFDLGGATPLDPAILRGCGTLVHLAAHIPRDHADPAEAATCWRLNALGTLRLAAAARSAGVRRILQLTSANAYAPHVDRPDESAPMFPTERVFYLASKIAQETYAGFAALRDGIGLTTLRVSSVYGPGQSSGAVKALASRMLRNDAVILANGGRFGADLVSVGDVCDALILALRQDATGPYNVGSGVRTTIAEVADRLCLLTGFDPGTIALDGTNDAAADRGFPALDIGKIRRLGYRPTDLDAGLRDFVAWLRSGPVAGRPGDGFKASAR